MHFAVKLIRFLEFEMTTQWALKCLRDPILKVAMMNFLNEFRKQKDIEMIKNVSLTCDALYLFLY